MEPRIHQSYAFGHVLEFLGASQAIQLQQINRQFYNQIVPRLMPKIQGLQTVRIQYLLDTILPSMEVFKRIVQRDDSVIDEFKRKLLLQRQQLVQEYDPNEQETELIPEIISIELKIPNELDPNDLLAFLIQQPDFMNFIPGFMQKDRKVQVFKGDILLKEYGVRQMQLQVMYAFGDPQFISDVEKGKHWKLPKIKGLNILELGYLYKHNIYAVL